MIWDDKGYLISKIKYNENSVIAEFYTKNHGKTSGIIFGASSKKIKNYLLIGNKFFLNFNGKNEGKIGYFKLEIDKINTPVYFDNKKKLFLIIYAMNLLRFLTVENQQNLSLYLNLKDFFKILNKDNWIKNYILWELNFLKDIGYDLDFKNYAVRENINGSNKYVVKSNNATRIIPNFLINNADNPENNEEIIIALKLVGDFLDKSILKPNNINFPVSRYEFINLLNN